MTYAYRNGKTYKKVNRSQARQAFRQGEWVYLMPNKVRFDSLWIAPTPIHNLHEPSFDGAVDAFNYYNCNSETGRCAYYIRVKENY